MKNNIHVIWHDCIFSEKQSVFSVLGISPENEIHNVTENLQITAIKGNFLPVILESPWPFNYKYCYHITEALLVKCSRVWYYQDKEWIGLSLVLLPDPNWAKLNFPNDSKQSSHQLVCQCEKSIFRAIDQITFYKLHFVGNYMIKLEDFFIAWF